MNQVVTIRDRRQITIPRPFLNQFGLDIGDRLILKLESDTIKMEPINTKTVDLLTKIQQVIKESNVSEKQLQTSGNDLRKRLARGYSK